MKTNLVLIGYRGAGKSFFAKKASELLGLSLFSSDQEVEKNLPYPIKKFVAVKGWDEYRKIERKVLLENLDKCDCLYDIGGGAIMHTDIMDQLKLNSTFCYIKVDANILIERLEADNSRPMLNDKLPIKEEVNHNLVIRQPIYQKYANFIIENNSDLASAENALQNLVEQYKKLLSYN